MSITVFTSQVFSRYSAQIPTRVLTILLTRVSFAASKDVEDGLAGNNTTTHPAYNIARVLLVWLYI